MNMVFNPPLRRNGVEVASINETLHTIHFIVHVVGANAITDVQTMEGRAHISSAVRDMVRYLEMEGYIKPKQNWLTHMGVMIHASDWSGSSVKLKDY